MKEKNMTDNNNYKMHQNGQMVGYFAVIPASIRYDKRLSPNAKLLYGEITALSNDKGFCWASNNYFAELYGVTKVSVSKWISELEKAGHIVRRIVRNENNTIVRREIYLAISPSSSITETGVVEIENKVGVIEIEEDEKLGDPIKEKDDTPIKEKFKTPLRKVYDPHKEKFKTPIKEKFKENNTDINNTLNNTKNIDIGAREKKETVNSIINDFTDNEELIDALKGFVEMRREIKAKLTPRAMKLALTELQKQSNDIDTQIKIVNQSVIKCWKSFFPLDDKQLAKDNRFDKYKF